MADLARADGDTADADRHLKLAKAWVKKAADLDGQAEINEARRMRLAADFAEEC
jgi:predicted YcjX-like family ATPase